MARSWEFTPVIEPTAGGHRTFSSLGALGHDLPFLARYAGHLIVMLLLLLMIRNIVPNVLPTPAVSMLQVSTPGMMAQGDPSELMLATSLTHNLEPNAVPLTLNVMRDVLPMVVPERTIRTTVSTYVVQPNDTVLGIAQQFGLSGNSLLWANDDLADNPDFLHVGQQLNILPVDGAYHTVAAKETIETIAAKYKVDPSAITGYGGNDLKAPFTLSAGQKLIIPGGTKPYVPRPVLAFEAGSVSAPAGAKKGTGGLAWPMSGSISQGYWAGHQAIDIASRTGTPIAAADAGFVASIQVMNYGYGRMLIIDHGNGIQTLYAHMSAFYVELGQSVAKGQNIGACGTTGNATGPHLHFEVMKNGVRQNPLNYLP
jgi:murein DD-endopeptidase MepM/ murein hydrolase activator NlpD